MIIKGIKLQNVKKLKALSLNLVAGIIKVCGKNEQGKTCLFDAIRMAIGGGHETEEKPVRDGQDKAVIELDLGDIVVKRTITAKGGNTVTIDSKDKGRLSKPQDVLNSLYNKISFNLMRFINMNGKEKYAILKDVLGVGDKIEKMEAKYKALYDDRTNVNRDIKTTTTKMNSIEVDDMVGCDKISVSDVAEELEKANNFNLSICNKQKDIDNLIEKREEEVARAEELRLSLKESEDLCKKLKEEIKCHEANLSPLKEIDTEAIKAKMSRLEETNAIVDQNIKHRDLKKELDEQQASADKINADMDKITSEIKETMESLEMPIKGLSMANGDVLFDGIPIDQASASRKLRVSMAIAIALNPELKVVLITDASLLDSEAMAEVEKMAEENQMQVWVELVDESGEVGIVIEDGEVVPVKVKDQNA